MSELSPRPGRAVRPRRLLGRTIDDQEIGGEPRSRERDPVDRPPERVLTIWEVPVLEPGWPQRLEWRRTIGPAR